MGIAQAPRQESLATPSSPGDGMLRCSKRSDSQITSVTRMCVCLSTASLVSCSRWPIRTPGSPPPHTLWLPQRCLMTLQCWGQAVRAHVGSPDIPRCRALVDTRV